MILIAGGKGQLGTAMNKIFSDVGEKFISFDRDDLDIANKKEVFEVLEKYKPDVVINCAAYNKVEQAEIDIDEAYKNNAFGPFFLAQATHNIGASLVHVSTDYVFDGGKDVFAETDCPRPLNVYGASKFAGEQLVWLANKKSYIIRTSWLFGKNSNGNGNNFITTMLAKAKAKENLKVVNDQVGSPTYTDDLAKKIHEVLLSNAEFGIYHITNSGQCSWYEFAKKIFEILKIDVNLISIKTSESGTKIKRPSKSVLKNDILEKNGIAKMRDWTVALESYLQEIIIN